MTTFDDREHAYEEAFSRDEEAKFKIRARRDNLFGEWIAALMGLHGKDATEYAVSFVLEDLKHPGDKDVTDKAISDLAEKGISISEDELNIKLIGLFRKAQAQYKEEIGAK